MTDLAQRLRDKAIAAGPEPRTAAPGGVLLFAQFLGWSFDLP